MCIEALTALSLVSHIKMYYSNWPAVFVRIIAKKKILIQYFMYFIYSFFYQETVNIISAYLVGFLIEYFTPKSKINRNEAFAYATGIAVVTFVNGILHHSVSYHLEVVGLKIRTSITSMLYKKVDSLEILANTNHSLLFVKSYIISLEHCCTWFTSIPMKQN